jgi:hypothetical protein
MKTSNALIAALATATMSFAALCAADAKSADAHLPNLLDLLASVASQKKSQASPVMLVDSTGKVIGRALQGAVLVSGPDGLSIALPLSADLTFVPDPHQLSGFSTFPNSSGLRWAFGAVVFYDSPGCAGHAYLNGPGAFGSSRAVAIINTQTGHSALISSQAATVTVTYQSMRNFDERNPTAAACENVSGTTKLWPVGSSMPLDTFIEPFFYQ